MTLKLPKLIATSVVRGSQQGESHGGIFIVDFDAQSGEQLVDWNTSGIDFDGRGADRGLRGITFDQDDVYVAASDELYCYDRKFERKRSFRNRYLKHCHEIVRMERRIFLTSTGFDCLLAFNLDTNEFDWGFQLIKQYDQWKGYTFDPRGDAGPRAVNDFHINMVHVDSGGIFLSGLRTNALLQLESDWSVSEYCNLPPGTHNGRPWHGGVVFNDTANDCVRYVPRAGKPLAFTVPSYDPEHIELAGIDDSKVARQGFGRGLCIVNDRLIAAGSSPSTISLYDTESRQKVGSVNLSMDIRNAIHGLEVWPDES
ncbi:MAG: hypothetical protein K0U72_03315 [Gammaproteobacteria bacterium]|nr:hypothetical protein [Gammaproteobacteria bacterium]